MLFLNTILTLQQNAKVFRNFFRVLLLANLDSRRKTFKVRYKCEGQDNNRPYHTFSLVRHPEESGELTGNETLHLYLATTRNGGGMPVSWVGHLPEELPKEYNHLKREEHLVALNALFVRIERALKAVPVAGEPDIIFDTTKLRLSVTFKPETPMEKIIATQKALTLAFQYGTSTLSPHDAALRIYDER